MQSGTTVILTAIIVAAIVTILNFKFLFYPVIPSFNPTRHMQKLNLKGKTLILSDLHLEFKRPFKYTRELRAFIQGRHMSNMIVNGDLLNSPKAARVILTESEPNSVLRRLGLENLDVNFYWVIGSSPHDPSNPVLQSTNVEGFTELGNCVSINLGETRVILYHGHDMGVRGVTSHVWDRFISKLSLERAWKKLATVDTDTWVLFGHTHIPGIDSQHRVANSGGWQTVPFVKPTKTGLIVSEEQRVPELVTIA